MAVIAAVGDDAFAELDPQPPAEEVPAVFASPFDPGEPGPLARRAARELIAQLGRAEDGRLRGALGGQLQGAPGESLLAASEVDELHRPGGGKMFGVLVVAAPDGRVGYLRGFSGMLGGAWHRRGFVPPLFDAVARDAFWPAGERRLGELDRALRELADSPALIAARGEHAAMLVRHAAELAALRDRHRASRAARAAARAAVRAGGSAAGELAVAAAAGHAQQRAFDQPIVDHEAERSRLAAVHAAERDACTAGLAALDAACHAVDQASRGDAAPGAVDAALHALDPASRAVDAALHELAQASRGDAAERRRLLAAHAAERDAIAAQLAALAAARADLAARRAALSRQLMQQLHDGYVIVSARGVRRPLRALFAPGEPPSGAGDCAGPKLLGHAHRLGLRPLALAELWWGAPPASGGRHAGQFYPSCRGKCGPLVPFQLDGLPLAAPPVFGAPGAGRVRSDAVIAAADTAPGAAAIVDDEPPVVFEDRWLIVVDKPCGLLSVPGRDPGLRDSVATRLAARWPGACVVHRLDLDTSGLLVAAKDRATHAALQAAFARREIDKRYAALLDGPVAGECGTIDLPLRVDLDDRPRQIVDPVHGKPAITEWRVIARSAAGTRVLLVPRTGRTHQLRVHAAHPLGLAAPIVGDRLYGRGGARLALHAEAIGFVHPHTGRRVEIERPAPF